MDTQSYFERIGYRGVAAATVETLFDLHRAHCMSVPFENLDIHLGRPIGLDARTAYDKIVGRRRGGFCYELNLLFADLLRHLGFEVAILEGRVVRNGAQGLSYGHLMLKVESAGAWLVDVGFGDGSHTPLNLADRTVKHHPEGEFQIQEADGIYTMWCRTLTEDLAAQYQFDLEARPIEAFAARCAWTQRSPESGFTQRIICSLPTDNGREGILGTECVTFRNGEKCVQPLTRSERDEILINRFGIDLEGAELPWPK